MGRSRSLYSNICDNFFFASLLHKPSAATNSVQKTTLSLFSLSFPYFANIKRKATSVTSDIGARQKNGFFSFCQKLLICFIGIYHKLYFQNAGQCIAVLNNYF